MSFLELENRLQFEVDKMVDKNDDVFNAVLGIRRIPDDFDWRSAAGTGYTRKNEAMPDTPFFIASITKMYTSAAVLILEEKGQLSLDDPLTKHLPSELISGLHRFKGQEYSEYLRIYHLISQTSGLPDYFQEKPPGGDSLFSKLTSGADEEWDVEKAVAIAKNLTPKFPPEPEYQLHSGSKAYYSDTNYQLLGAVIQSVMEKPYYEVISELILDPLGLARTYFHGLGAHSASIDISPAQIYFKTQPLSLDKAMTSFGPDGGMVSNLDDCLNFLRAYTHGELFSSPGTLERVRKWKKIFFPFQYGLGLMRFKLPRIFSPFKPLPALIGHSGSTSAFLFYNQRDQLYIAGTLNQIENQGRPFQFMLKIIDIINKSTN